MPRLRLSVVPVAVLQAELARRVKNLRKMIAQRDELDRQIEQLQSLSPMGVEEAKGKAAGRRRRRRRRYEQTGQEFVLDLLKDKGLKTSDITKAWAQAGRAGKAENVLTALINAKKIKREKLKRGSLYNLA